MLCSAVLQQQTVSCVAEPGQFSHMAVSHDPAAGHTCLPHDRCIPILCITPAQQALPVPDMYIHHLGHFGHCCGPGSQSQHIPLVSLSRVLQSRAVGCPVYGCILLCCRHQHCQAHVCLASPASDSGFLTRLCVRSAFEVQRLVSDLMQYVAYICAMYRLGVSSRRVLCC